MKRILIIEDSKERIAQFEKNFKNVDMTYVKSTKEAIAAIKKSGKTFDYMFFDHDLGPGGDSIDVVNWLLNHKNKCAANVYIHSANPVGAQNIQNRIPFAKKAPMIWKKVVDFK